MFGTYSQVFVVALRVRVPNVPVAVQTPALREPPRMLNVSVLAAESISVAASVPVRESAPAVRPAEGLVGVNDVSKVDVSAMPAVPPP